MKFSRRKRSSRQDELTKRTREEGRALRREQRVEARRARRARREETEGFEEIGVRLRGTAFETRRRLRPVASPPGRFFAWIAPYITGSLMFAIKVVAALIALIAETGQVAAAWLARSTVAVSAATWRTLQREVTPVRTVAFVGVAAAVGLGVSQFFDYHGVAVGAPGYAGPIGNIAHVPITGTETAGSAHLWVLVPVAVAAALLTIGASRGRPRLAGGVAVCGLLGIAVAIAVDLPQGLDAGRPGLAFTGSEAVLLQGFWAEVACSAVLVLCGGLLPLYSPGRARRRGRGPRSARRRRRVSREDVGGISPGLQTET